MKRLQIPSALAFVLGVVMAILGQRLPLHQNDLANQTNGEFIIHVSLMVGGVLIALIAACTLGWSFLKRGGQSSVLTGQLG